MAKVLVVPQATLGGRVKGKSLQYHGNIAPQAGAQLYSTFVKELEEVLGEERVRSGTYGARQVLSTTTTGPYTHSFDIA